jgi:uncharacterized protein YceK
MRTLVMVLLTFALLGGCSRAADRLKGVKNTCACQRDAY